MFYADILVAREVLTEQQWYAGADAQGLGAWHFIRIPEP